jgi:hypothetical protein
MNLGYKPFRLEEIGERRLSQARRESPTTTFSIVRCYASFGAGASRLGEILAGSLLVLVSGAVVSLGRDLSDSDSAAASCPSAKAS